MAARALIRLDKHLSGPGVFEFDQEGWQCEVNIQSVRQWIRAVTVYAGSSHTKLLDLMAAAL
eukprot:788378-Pyramimonas_sp.AAC.1